VGQNVSDDENVIHDVGVERDVRVGSAGRLLVDVVFDVEVCGLDGRAEIGNVSLEQCRERNDKALLRLVNSF